MKALSVNNRSELEKTGCKQTHFTSLSISAEMQAKLVVLILDNLKNAKMIVKINTYFLLTFNEYSREREDNGMHNENHIIENLTKIKYSKPCLGSFKFQTQDSDMKILINCAIF